MLPIATNIKIRSIKGIPVKDACSIKLANIDTATVPISDFLKILIKVEARKIKQQIKDIATQKYKAKPKQLITSEYGEKDKYSFEWFAEVFAESQLHTTEKPIVKAMKDYLKEEIKDVQI